MTGQELVLGRGAALLIDLLRRHTQNAKRVVLTRRRSEPDVIFFRPSLSRPYLRRPEDLHTHTHVLSTDEPEDRAGTEAAMMLLADEILGQPSTAAELWASAIAINGQRRADCLTLVAVMRWVQPGERLTIRPELYDQGSIIVELRRRAGEALDEPLEVYQMCISAEALGCGQVSSLMATTLSNIRYEQEHGGESAPEDSIMREWWESNR